MKTNFPQLFFADRNELHSWLQKNHSRSKGIWLIYFKKHTGKPTVSYDEAVEEALCFGWIDSTVKKLDEERYMQKFTPRKDDSNWSELNRKRVEKLIRNKKMDFSGLEKIRIAKQNGKWKEVELSKKEFVLTEEIIQLIKIKPKAYQFYQSLSPALTRQYTAWIMSAAKPETRIRRANKLIESLQKEEKLNFM
jgi:uncharacterized protein YdeI (YjbR/CyaY-like superfamily)